MPYATIATGMVTMLGSVHLHHARLREVEDRCVVNGLLEDAEVDVEEEDEGTCRSLNANPCHVGAVGTSGV